MAGKNVPFNSNQASYSNLSFLNTPISFKYLPLQAIQAHVFQWGHESDLCKCFSLPLLDTLSFTLKLREKKPTG